MYHPQSEKGSGLSIMNHILGWVTHIGLVQNVRVNVDMEKKFLTELTIVITAVQGW